MSDFNYRCLNCGVFAIVKPDTWCPNCDGHTDDYIETEEDWEKAAEGEAQFDYNRENNNV